MITELQVLNYFKEKDTSILSEPLRKEDVKKDLCHNKTDEEEFNKIFRKLNEKGDIFEMYPQRYKLL